MVGIDIPIREKAAKVIQFNQMDNYLMQINISLLSHQGLFSTSYSYENYMNTTIIQSQLLTFTKELSKCKRLLMHKIVFEL